MRAVILLALLLPGCVSLGGRDSFVILPDGRMVKIRCQSDGVVDLTQGDLKVRVDNRGPVGQIWAAGAAAIGKGQEAVKEAVKW